MTKTQLINHLKSQAFPDEILEAFKMVKREKFIPESYKNYAYEDSAMPIGYGSTISQPYTIAFMLNLLELKPNQVVLEIGSGSGYVLALINQITKSKVFGVEIIRQLANSSQELLKQNHNITIINQNGKDGLPKHAPYDRILISASCPKIPKHLIKQLKPNGIIVASVNESIVKIKKQNTKTKMEQYPGFVFVPLVRS